MRVSIVWLSINGRLSPNKASKQNVVEHSVALSALDFGDPFARAWERLSRIAQLRTDTAQQGSYLWVDRRCGADTLLSLMHCLRMFS